jgi:hypothetical protein
MPNHYKNQGQPVQLCFSSPMVPDTGASPPDGSPPAQFDLSMVTPNNPTQPCGPQMCPTSCCGGDGGAPGGAPGGGKGGGPPRSITN